MSISMRSARIAAFLAAGCLASCGGSGGGGASSRPPAPSIAGGGAATATVRIVLTLAPKPASASRRPRYVPPNVASLKIAAAALAAPAILNVTTSSGGCATTAGTTTCRTSLTLPTGTVTFTVGAYDGSNATGTLLATSVLPFTIAANAANVVPITLDGILANVALSLAPPIVAPSGAGHATLTVTGYDTGGNAIVGPGAYVDANDTPVPITITSTDTSGHVKIAGAPSATVTGPAGSALAIDYDGSGIAGGSAVTFSAAIGGSARASAALAFGNAGTTIYVADGGSGDVLAFPGGSSGAVSPLRRISASMAYPEQFAYDGAGNIYVTDDNGNVPPLYQERVVEFAAGASGAAAPIRTIAGPATGFGGASIWGIAVDAQNDVWVVWIRNGSSNISCFAPTASGNAAPLGSFSVANVSQQPAPLSFDAAGNLWLGNHGTITEYLAAGLAAICAGGKTAPATGVQISGPATLLTAPTAVAVDSSGNVYASQTNGTNSVLVFAAGSTGNVAPARVIGGLRYANGIAFDGAGNFWVNDETGPTTFLREYAAGTTGSATPIASITAPSQLRYNCFATVGIPPQRDRIDALDNCTMSIYRYAPGASGNASPVRTIFSPGVYPESIAVDASGSVYVTNTGAPGIAIFPPGVAGFPAAARFISGPQTQVVNPRSVAVDTTGAIYDAETATNTLPARIAVFSPGADGNVAPVRQLGGAATTMTGPSRAVVDASGTVYVLDAGNILVFPAGATGNTPPTRTITPTAIGLASLTSITVDPAGTLYVLGAATTKTYVAVVTAGTATVARTIDVTSTSASARDIAVDGMGGVYLLTRSVYGNTVVAYAPGASGTATPVSTFNGTAAGMYVPYALAIGP